MPLLLAEELDTLTVEDIQELDASAGGRLALQLQIIDKPNLTDERSERLECLVYERDEPPKSRAVNADELTAKLQQISPRRSPASSDTASTPVTAGGETTAEEHLEFMRCRANEYYKKLKDMGGRPSRAINPDPGPCPSDKSDVDKEYHISDHWGREVGRLRDELTRWLDFRRYQFKNREDSEIFNKYTESVHKYREKKAIDLVVELRLDRQTKLDEWREYYVYEHRRRPPLERKLERAEREQELSKERMRNAQRNGSVGVASTTLQERWEDLREYEAKISRAQKKVGMAQKRLEVVRVEESLSGIDRDIMITRAEKELESAQKSLEAEKSDELDQLSKEAERDRAQNGLAYAQGEVDWANTRLERLDTLLEWIAGQFAEIPTEYALSSRESRHNRDLLEGWEKYYIYMREMLQTAQGSLAEEVQEEVQGRVPKHKLCVLQLEKDNVKRKEEEFKTLQAWIEREFPEIAAKYAPSGRDSQSNGDHQGEDQAILPYSKTSPNESARKASRSNVGNSTRRKGRSAREQSPLSQAQPSKVSKPIQRRRRLLNENLNATRHAVWPPGGDANDVGPAKEQEPREMVVRRSKRIAQRACDPAPTLVCTREKSSRCRPDGTLRRSARISERTEKLHSLGSDQDVKPAQSSTTPRRKTTRHTAAHTNAA